MDKGGKEGKGRSGKGRRERVKEERREECLLTSLWSGTQTTPLPHQTPGWHPSGEPPQIWRQYSLCSRLPTYSVAPHSSPPERRRYSLKLVDIRAWLCFCQKLVSCTFSGLPTSYPSAAAARDLPVPGAPCSKTVIPCRGRGYCRDNWVEGAGLQLAS